MQLPALLRTSVFQLTLLYMALFGISVATVGVFVYWSTVGFLQSQTDEVIEAEINGLAEQYRQRGLNGLVEIINERQKQTNEERSAYLLVDGARRKVTGNLLFWPPQFDQPNEWVEFSVTAESGADVPVRAQVIRLTVGREVFGLLVGREIRELQQIKQTFARASILGLSLSMGLALIGGIAMGLSAQRRVAQLNRTTRHIIAGDLSQRVPITGARDEHAELAANVNTMLDQIENLLSDLRHVGDSIAHDLRSPLTRLRSRLEMLANESQPTKQGIDECIVQADGLLETFNALLRIARVESGAYRSAFAEIDLALIVQDVAELYQATADERQIKLTCKNLEHGIVFGDRELLAQALTNLLDNAFKHSSAGGGIDMELRRNADRIVVSVADTGPGIPAQERDRVLNRFARVDAARSKPGNGLGLALVRAVADQHDAMLWLTDNAPGLRVTISLPAAAVSRLA
jgi:signal transduction histidine kinase